MQIGWLGTAVFLAAAGTGWASLPWQSLFNGSDLAGWKVPQPNPFWKVAAEGVLVGENNPALSGSMLYTLASYQDFLFETEVRWSEEIDSGIMLRKPELQLQIGVSRSLQRDMTCSFYTGSYPPSGQGQGVEPLLRGGQWNTIRLEALGGLFSVWLNGTLVTEFPNTQYGQAAPIGLQIHAGLTMKVEFRNLRLIAAPVADADEDGLPDAWERGHWSSLRHGAAEDLDSDGLNNLLECALALNPTVPSSDGLPRQDIDLIDGASYPTLTIARNPAASSLAFRVEASDDLVGWRGGALEFVTLEDTPARLRVRATRPMEVGLGQFFRLRVSPP